MNTRRELPLDFAERLVSLVASDRGGRRVPRLCRPEYWQLAVEKITGLSRAAVVSGFFVPSANAPETDGPCGAVILARALLGHGTESEIWTDSLCLDAMKACASAAGFPAERVRISDGERDLDLFSPDGVIFIERLGRAADGKYYNMRKKDVSQWTRSLDDLVQSCEKRGVATVGIGDGGNEIGMGNFLEDLRRMLPDYAECLSVIRTDAAIPVDISNWGCYALTAALSYIWGEWCGPNAGDERAMLEALKESGAVDGISVSPDLSVDGFPLPVHEALISNLYSEWKRFSR